MTEFAQEINEIERKMEEIKALLISPTMDSIEAANRLAGESKALLEAFSQKQSDAGTEQASGQVDEIVLINLQKPLRLIQALAQATSQFHLEKMRWVWEATQTYTPSGGLMAWQPEPRQIDSEG